MDLSDKTLGQYQILEELGRGGMAVVYRAYQPALERYVAIKVLPRELSFDRAFVERFLREARSAAGLNHPHIVTIHDVGQAEGNHFIVMEYVDGPSLTDLLQRQGAIPPQQAAQIVSQIASALDYAHHQGFVHRDVKPANILLGAGQTAKLTDFGIVKAAEGTRLTQTGTLLGTPAYMSPEQARGVDITYSTDIYSLGVVAYEMLSGRVLFSGETMAVLHAHAYELPELSHLRSHLQAVLGRALAKKPSQRHPSAGSFARELKQALTGDFVESIASPSPQSLAQVPAWVWGVGVAVVVLGAVCALTLPIPMPPRTPTQKPTPSPLASADATSSSSIGSDGTTAVATPTATPLPTPHPTSDPRIAAEEVVRQFQRARATAYSTWNTEEYYDVLAGGALTSALETISQLKQSNCRYYVRDDSQMQFHYEEVSANRVVIVASRSETQRRICAGSTTFTCYAFDGYYVVERRGDRWLITQKSVQNLIETSPCPSSWVPTNTVASFKSKPPRYS